MQTEAKFCLCLTKINVNFFCGAPKLILVTKIFPSRKITKLFLRLSLSDDELSSAPNVMRFLAKLSLKLLPFLSCLRSCLFHKMLFRYYTMLRYSDAILVIIDILSYITVFYYVSCSKQTFF